MQVGEEGPVLRASFCARVDAGGEEGGTFELWCRAGRVASFVETGSLASKVLQVTTYQLR